MKGYLDIPSLIKSDYYASNDRLSWHLYHSEYDILSKNIYDLLNRITLEDQENKIFNIVKYILHSNISSYFFTST